MLHAHKSRRMSAREELAQLARIIRFAYAADDRPSFEELLHAVDEETDGSAPDLGGTSSREIDETIELSGRSIKVP